MKSMMFKPAVQKSILGLTLAAGVLSLSGCFPLVVGGAALTGTLVATDRRTSGTVVEDNAIQIKARSRIDDAMGDRSHVNVNAYNRLVLLTGEVLNEQDKQLAEKVAAGVENVREVKNELAVMGISTMGQRSSDAVVTTRVKAALVDAKDLFANAFKITTERGTVYLMGRVSQREVNRATEVVSGVSGVQRVVRILEVISEEDLARSLPPPEGQK